MRPAGRCCYDHRSQRRGSTPIALTMGVLALLAAGCAGGVATFWTPMWSFELESYKIDAGKPAAK